MATVAFHQARTLADSGVHVRVIIPDRGPADAPAGVEVIRAAPLLAVGNAACLPAVARLTAGFDVVHLHYPFFGTAELVAAHRALGGPPLVLQYQMDVVGEGGRRWLFQSHRRMLLPLIVRCADAIVVTSTDYLASSFLARQYAAAPARFTVLPAGVDLDRFSPAGPRRVLHAGRGARTIFFLAALDAAHYFKGLVILLEALRAVPDAVLVVGGDGPLRATYIAHAERLGVRDRVAFAGNIPDAELPAHYRGADVVVLPSVDRTEAFGLVLLEAMACGVPVVASRLPGLRTLVRDGVSGYLAAPGDAADLAEKIRLCLQRTQMLGEAARVHAAAGFDWKHLVRPLITLYERVRRARRDTGGISATVDVPEGMTAGERRLR